MSAARRAIVISVCNADGVSLLHSPGGAVSVMLYFYCCFRSPALNATDEYGIVPFWPNAIMANSISLLYNQLILLFFLGISDVEL